MSDSSTPRSPCRTRVHPTRRSCDGAEWQTRKNLSYVQTMADQREFASFEEFYPFYLSQHSKPATRAFHALGTGLALANTLKGLAFGPRKQVLLSPVIGYGFAWFSHFVIEGNKPATFGYPAYSFRGDFTMMLDMARGRNAQLQEIADDYLAMMAAEELADEAAEAFAAHPDHTPSPGTTPTQPPSPTLNGSAGPATQPA